MIALALLSKVLKDDKIEPLSSLGSSLKYKLNLEQIEQKKLRRQKMLNRRKEKINKTLQQNESLDLER